MTPSNAKWIPGTADWGMSEHLAAASALGSFAKVQMRVLAETARIFGDDDPVHRAANLSIERIIVAAVREAAAHAGKAEAEAERVALYLQPETRAYQEYVERFPFNEPRD